MRVRFLTNCYPPCEVGCYEQLCRDMVVCLTQRGYLARVLTGQRGVQERDYAGDPTVHRCLQLQDDTALHARLAKVGRRTALERFTLERMVDEMEGWLQVLGRMGLDPGG